MTKKDLAKLQKLLMQRREEVFNQAGDLEKRWREMSEPQVEFEETAQEVELTEPYAQLVAIIEGRSSSSSFPAGLSG